MDGGTWTKHNEGLALVSYRDTLGYWTIGYGHKLQIGPDWSGTTWTQDQADSAFEDDYQAALVGARTDVGIVCWGRLNSPRQAVLADMAFQMGAEGLGAFRIALGCLLTGDWNKAATEILNSLYAEQTPQRAKANAEIIRTGDWPWKSLVDA